MRTVYLCNIYSKYMYPVYHPGNYKAVWSSVSGTGVKDQLLEQKITLMLVSLRNFQGSQEHDRNWKQRPIYIFSITLQDTK